MIGFTILISLKDISHRLHATLGECFKKPFTILFKNHINPGIAPGCLGHLEHSAGTQTWAIWNLYFCVFFDLHSIIWFIRHSFVAICSAAIRFLTSRKNSSTAFSESSGRKLSITFSWLPSWQCLGKVETFCHFL